MSIGWGYKPPFMGLPTSGASLVARSELRTRTSSVLLEAIALRHQIAVLERNSSPVLPALRSAALDLALALVAGMARKPADRPIRDSLALAP